MAYTNAIFYIDLVSGNDATRATLSSCTASNPSGTITRITKTGHGLVTGAVVTLSNFTAWLNGAWKITRVDADNFDLDTAIWQATADATGDVVPFGGSSWSDAWLTITNGATAARIAPGDTIRISKTADPISIGNATWTDLSKTITLAAARTITVDRCETAWTAANSATVTRQGVATDAKEGSYCMQVAAPASPATNTKYAYYAISSTDFSSKQELTFWIKNEVAVAAGNWKICLCSDNAGATPVDTFEIIAIPSTGRWLPLTIARTGGGNLGNAIQSIALYSSSVAPTASKYLRLDNFEASSTDDLNLQTLISKNGAAQGGTEGYYGIQSIVGTTVLLDNETNTLANAGRGYSGTTETVNTYIRKTFKTALAASGSTSVCPINDSGTSGNNINWEFGYEVGTTNQNGETFLDGLNGNGYCIYLSSKNYNQFNYCSTIRYNYGINPTSSNFNVFTNISNCNNNTSYGIYFYGSHNQTIVNYSNGNNNGQHGFYIAVSNNTSIISVGCLNNNNSNGLNLYGVSSTIISTISNCNNNTFYGISATNSNSNIINVVAKLNDNVYNAVSFSNCSSNIINQLSTSGGSGFIIGEGINKIRKATINQSTEYSGVQWSKGLMWSYDHDNTEGNHWAFMYGATFNWQTLTKHDTDPGAWKTTITSADRKSNYKCYLPVAQVACEQNVACTVKAWVKKDHATNVACRLIVYADAALGIAADISDTKSDDTDWEQLSVTFTSTHANPVVEIVLESWYVAGTSNTYVGSIEIS